MLDPSNDIRSLNDLKYSRLLELEDKAEMLEFLRQSRQDVQRGRTTPAAEALEKLAIKHKLKSRQ